jgi:hypothetical protein
MIIIEMIGEPSAYSSFEYRLAIMKYNFDNYINDCIHIQWKALYVDMIKLLRSVFRHLDNMSKNLKKYWKRVATAMSRDAGSAENWHKIVETSHREIHCHIDNKIRAKILKQFTKKPSSKRMIQRVDNFIMFVTLHSSYIKDKSVWKAYWMLRELIGRYTDRYMCHHTQTIRNIPNQILIDKDKELPRKTYYIAALLKKVIRRIMIARFELSYQKDIQPWINIKLHNGLILEIIKKMLKDSKQRYYPIIYFKLLK